MENQFQNIPTYIEIFDDGGDEETQVTCKKSDLFKVHMKKIKNLMNQRWLLQHLSMTC